MSRANQWFVPGSDIAREVITADIQRYLGPDALVRPGMGVGDFQNQPGYWITAYRTLTTQMIQDLRSDSQHWQAERAPDAGRSGGVAYQDSRTHAARQHWGPTTPYDQQQQQQQPQQPQHPQHAQHQPQSRTYGDRSEPKSASRTSYNSGYSQYTTAAAPYEQSAYTSQQAEPRTTSQPSYYQQPGRQPSAYQPQAQYSQQAADYPSRTPSQPTNPYPQSQPEPGYYIASDGRQYPLSSQPASQRSTGGQGRGYTGRPGT